MKSGNRIVLSIIVISLVVRLDHQGALAQDYYDDGGGGGSSDVFTINESMGGDSDVVRDVHYEYDPYQGGNDGYNHNGMHHRPRPQNPFAGILPGIMCSIVSSMLLWWNEGRSVREAQMLKRAEDSVISYNTNNEDGDVETYLSSISSSRMEEKLIHISGPIASQHGLVDSEFGLHRPNALQLTRNTEGYQWVEDKQERRQRVNDREVRVEVTYKYRKVWSKHWKDSWNFKRRSGHENPEPRMELGTNGNIATDVTFRNGVHVPPDLVSKIGQSNTVRLGDGSKISLNNYNEQPAIISGNAIYLPEDPDSTLKQIGATSATSTTNSNADVRTAGVLSNPSETNSHNGKIIPRSKPGKTQDNVIVTRTNIRPTVGDIRVSWNEVLPPRGGVSILAQQKNGALIPWVDPRTGNSLYHIEEGKRSPKQMIHGLLERNKFMTNVHRVVGAVVNFMGWNMLFSVLPALVSKIPIFSMLSPLVGIATGVLAFGVSLGCSVAIISVAWLRFRPIIASGMLVLASLGFYGPWMYAKQQKQQEQEFPTSAE